MVAHDVTVHGAGNEREVFCAVRFAERTDQRDSAQHVSELIVLPDDEDVSVRSMGYGRSVVSQECDRARLWFPFRGDVLKVGLLNIGKGFFVLSRRLRRSCAPLGGQEMLYDFPHHIEEQDPERHSYHKRLFTVSILRDCSIQREPCRGGRFQPSDLRAPAYYVQSRSGLR
jgi:hypothetical protein